MVIISPSKNNTRPPAQPSITETEVSSRSVWINSLYAIKDCYLLANELIRSNRELSKTFIKNSSSREKFSEVLAIIVGSFAYQLSLGYQNKEFVTIPTGNSSKDALDRTGYSGKWLAKDLKFLDELGCVQTAYNHFYDRNTDQGRIAKYRCTGALISLLEQFNLIRLEYPHVSRFEVLETPKQTQIKHGDGRYGPVDNDPSEEVLRWLAQTLSNTRITLEGVPYEALRSRFDYKNKSRGVFVKPSQVVRTYTRSIDGNGRILLHSLQNLPKAFRERLLFNGAKTIELDYRSMHLFLLYRRAGKVLDYAQYPNGDPYDVGQAYALERCEVKDAFTVAMGHKSPQHLESTSSYQNTVHVGFSQRDRYRALECLFKAHPILEASLFEQDIAVKLQKEDSEIALAVLNRLMANDIPVIPVHESFIVKKVHAEHLRQAMQDALPHCSIH